MRHKLPANAKDLDYSKSSLPCLNFEINMKNLLTFLGLFIFSLHSFSQTNPFDISIESLSIPELGGVQSFAFAQHSDRWLIVGGRLDGLHRRQPWAAFDEAGHNNQLIVIDPISLQKWSASLSALPTSIREQLSSTNMNFHQEGDYLYCAGGYGYSNTFGDHTTFSNLTAINVSEVINAVINGTDFTAYFRQITDDMFQVTGGKLAKIYDTYYLLGGQKFIGRYNPMGPDHGPGFEQEYTNAIRRFVINDDGTTLSINRLSAHIDSENLHRRDYNAVAQILPNGEEGITMFSGVFQYDVDLPFLNSVTIDSNDYVVNNDFQQYYNHYHCAFLPLYSENLNEMHNVFFGGIAQYYDSLGVLIQDNNVPFVKTIARVTRDENGDLAEYKLPIEMPSLLGAGSEFIPNKNIPHFENGVFKLDSIVADTVVAGYIFGGISSSAANIFWTNDGTQSNASSQVFKVNLIKNNGTVSVHQLNEESVSSFDFEIYPNPNSDGQFTVEFQLKQTDEVPLIISDINGQTLGSILLKSQYGKNTFTVEAEELYQKGTYFVSLQTKYHRATKKIVIY
ncbi:MAG: T9SS type A sorting domain-containing protein [Saprospiraceae bacterium]